ncbi:unnamed protein product [Symbiodinium microadriaticum]|nr:unnamed protein product [Symbiodinium microadriaticum]CAE7388862.1 unnamed protein product [Symbiodinium sp. KB8]
MGAFKFAAEIPKLKLQRSLCSIWLLVTEAPASVPRELHSQMMNMTSSGVSGNVHTEAGVAMLNEMMKTRSYIADTSYATSQDMDIYAEIHTPPNREKFPYAHRWYSHIQALKARYAPYYVFPEAPQQTLTPEAEDADMEKEEHLDVREPSMTVKVGQSVMHEAGVHGAAKVPCGQDPCDGSINVVAKAAMKEAEDGSRVGNSLMRAALQTSKPVGPCLMEGKTAHEIPGAETQ